MRYLILFTIFSSILFAQNTSVDEALKYYPLQTGNYWEYKSNYWSDPYYSVSSAYSISVIGDTLLPNNYLYKILLEKNIPDNGSSTKLYERVDSSTACVYRYSTDTVFNNNEFLVDSLMAESGDYFAGSITGYSSSDDYTFYSLCVDEYEDTVFNLITKIKEFQDQSFVPGVSYKLAAGFGQIYSISCEFSCGSSNLVYALIDRVEYGDKITEVIVCGPDILPDEYILYQNYPNPFNPSTNISFYLPQESKVILKIYDLRGALVNTLVNEQLQSGRYDYTFDASNYSSGLYFYQLSTNGVILTKKMLLIK